MDKYILSLAMLINKCCYGSEILPVLEMLFSGSLLGGGGLITEIDI